MHIALIIISSMLLLCLFASKALYRLGVPSLLIFIILGMMMGSDGIGVIDFHNFDIAEDISSLALVFIMFYGGFGTKWSTSKSTALKAGLMSSLGTILTAITIGFFSSIILGIPFLYGLLLGAVVSPTDAASVFSILHSRKLNLKYGLVPLLEVESGSNDPFAYMLTILTVTAIQMQEFGRLSVGYLASAIALQLGIAIAIGGLMSVLTVVLLKHLRLENDGYYPILLLSIIILSYSTCVLAGGNGFLCAYIMGIVIGNNKFHYRRSTVHFFDGLSWLMQITLFFLLGLVSFPTRLPAVIAVGTMLSVLLIVVARPLATACILSWFKTPFKQQAFVSWVGLRGAASIVFAIIVVKELGDTLPYDLFHIVFFIALFSVLVQGTLTPLAAKRLSLIEKNE